MAPETCRRNPCCYVVTPPTWCPHQAIWYIHWFVTFFHSMTMKVEVTSSLMEHTIQGDQNQCPMLQFHLWLRINHDLFPLEEELCFSVIPCLAIKSPTVPPSIVLAICPGPGHSCPESHSSSLLGLSTSQPTLILSGDLWEMPISSFYSLSSTAQWSLRLLGQGTHCGVAQKMLCGWPSSTPLKQSCTHSHWPFAVVIPITCPP